MTTIETQCGAYLYTGQSTSAAFATKTDVVTKPSGANVIDLAHGNNRPVAVPSKLLLHPNGVGSDNDTFDFKVWGVNPYFNKAAVDADKRETWHYTLLGGFVATLNSSFKGVNRASIEDEIFYADTITLRTGEGGAANIAYEIITLPDIAPAYIKLPTLGFWLFEIEFDMTGATSGGVLVKPY